MSAGDEGSSEKPCRTCMDFKSWMKSQSETQTKYVKDKKEQTNSGMMKLNLDYGEEEYGRRRRPTAKPKITMEENIGGKGAKLGCPADSLSLGRGSWRLLHTMASYYPDAPTPTVKEDMNQFITLFSKFYPCPPCASDFREWIKENPPEVSSRTNLGQWFCRAHNDVNRKLGKPEFDCKLYDQRWLDGWTDGSCG